MLVERSTLQQSAVGALLAGLGRSQNPDAPSFQQHFTETVNAITPRRQTPQRERQPIEQDIADTRPRTERPRSEDENDPPSEPERAAAAEAVAPVEANQRVESNGPLESDEPVSDIPDEPTTERQAEGEMETAPAQDAAEETTFDYQSGRLGQIQMKAMMLQELQHTDNALASLMTIDAPVSLMTVSSEQTSEVVAAADPEVTPQEKVAEVQATQATDLPVAGQTEAIAVREIEMAVSAAATAEAALGQSANVQQQEAGPRVVSPTARRREVRQVVAPMTENAAAQVDRTTEVGPARSPVQPAAGQTVSSTTLEGRQVRPDVVSVQVVNAPVSTTGGGEGATGVKGEAVDLNPNPQSGPVRLLGGAAQTEQADRNQQVERIAQVMRASISRGGSRVNLQLDPPELGQLRIQMQIRNGELMARFETETEAARRWVTSQLSSLREALATQNIRLVSATVETRSDADQSGGQAGRPGNFSAGAQTGSQQPQQQHTASENFSTESDVPQWAEAQADENELDVVA